MQIPSDTVTHKTNRSVFGNFSAGSGDLDQATSTAANVTASQPLSRATLQEQIDEAMTRCFVYRFLAAGFEYPSEETWNWLTSPETQLALQASLTGMRADPATAIVRSSVNVITHLRADRLDEFIDGYLSAFGHAARGPCPMNEIEYGDLKADPLFQPHRLADLAAFYRAFGLEVGGDGAERQDHLSIELEFMSVLAGKKAFAIEHQLDDEIALCQDAERKFLREHLGRWLPACIWRLSKSLPDGPLAALARFVREFVAADCLRLCIKPGSEDLMLRPVDEAGESLCSSCGITNLPPGALTTT